MSDRLSDEEFNQLRLRYPVNYNLSPFVVDFQRFRNVPSIRNAASYGDALIDHLHALTVEMDNRRNERWVCQAVYACYHFGTRFLFLTIYQSFQNELSTALRNSNNILLTFFDNETNVSLGILMDELVQYIFLRDYYGDSTSEEEEESEDDNEGEDGANAIAPALD